MSAAPVDDAALRGRVHARLLAEDLERAEHLDRAAVRDRLGALLRTEEPLLAAARHARLVEELAYEVCGLGPLEPLLADPSVTEVMVNGPHRAYVERGGRLERVELTLDAAAIVRIVERVVGPLGLRIDRSSPMVDARLADGARLHAVIPPLAVDGPCLTIRRFGVRVVPLAAFGLGATATAFLEWAVGAGCNVLVSGGTGAGKTTLLNALSSAMGPDERVVTIEETAELQLTREHVVRLESRPANAEGVGAVSVRELVRTALRMRPDRLLVGEVRGPEALDMLQALNTGHDGSLSTIHANGPLDALARLETLVLVAGAGLPVTAVRAQIASSIDLVVHVARGIAGVRCVDAIAEVGPGARSVRILFQRGADGLVACAAATRRARRPGPGAAAEWFAC